MALRVTHEVHQMTAGAIRAVGPSQTARSGEKPRLTTPTAVIVAMTSPITRPRCRALRVLPVIGPRAQSASLPVCQSASPPPPW